jgi:hypothetical protein
MAGGMLTKQADFLTAKFLNQVNDTAAGGVIVSLPAGAPSPAVSQTLPGDRIVLDDATALALSGIPTGLSTVQNLYGGVYMYVQTLSSSTAAPALGAIAFWRTTDLGSGATPQYQCSADALPTTAIPVYIAGIFINAITKGNFGWIQVAGLATVLPDSALTATTAGAWASAKVSAAVASTADAGAVIGVVTLPAQLGVWIGTPAASTLNPCLLTRGLFGGRV